MSNLRVMPPPSRGWSSELSTANPNPAFASTARGVLCRPWAVTTQPQPTLWGTITAREIVALMEYPRASGNELWAWGRTATPGSTVELYNATPGGAISGVVATATAVAGVARPPAFTTIATGAGVFLLTAAGNPPSGTGGVFQYNGTTWSSIGTFGGLDSRLVLRLATYKQRIYFTEAGTLNLWFLPPNSISGSATRYPLGAVFARGGTIVDIMNWTLDSGSGPDDQLVVLSSNGEVAVFTGTDPSSPFTWSLAGVYFLGIPRGHAPLVKAGGDVWVSTENGLYSLTAALRAQIVGRNAEISANINRAWKERGILRLAHFSPQDSLLWVGLGPSVTPPASITGAGAGLTLNFPENFCYALDSTAWSEVRAQETSAFVIWRGRLVAGTRGGEITYPLGGTGAPVPWGGGGGSIVQPLPPAMARQNIQLRMARPLLSALILPAELTVLVQAASIWDFPAGTTQTIPAKTGFRPRDTYWVELTSLPGSFSSLAVTWVSPSWAPVEYQGLEVELAQYRRS